jgi:hypothetical protein
MKIEYQSRENQDSGYKIIESNRKPWGLKAEIVGSLEVLF